MRWWARRRERKHCPHRHLEGIYGDNVHAHGGYRLFCTDCGALLDGPVSLADERPPPPRPLPEDRKVIKVTEAQVSAARARVEADKRLGHRTPDWIKRVASLSNRKPWA